MAIAFRKISLCYIHKLLTRFIQPINNPSRSPPSSSTPRLLHCNILALCLFNLGNNDQNQSECTDLSTLIRITSQLNTTHRLH